MWDWKFQGTSTGRPIFTLNFGEYNICTLSIHEVNKSQLYWCINRFYFDTPATTIVLYQFPYCDVKVPNTKDDEAVKEYLQNFFDVAKPVQDYVRDFVIPDFKQKFDEQMKKFSKYRFISIKMASEETEYYLNHLMKENKGESK